MFSLKENATIRRLAKIFTGKEKIINKDSSLPIIQTAPVKRTEFYIDADKSGLFIRIVHGTSSANIGSISEYGLRPILNIKDSLVNYLISLNSNLNRSQIELLLTPEHLNRRKNCNTQLVSLRLDNDSHGSVLYMLPLFGAEGYLKGACNNAQLDGGEVFRAARHVLEEHIGQTLQPKFPDAYPAVAMAKCYFEKDMSNDLQISGVQGVQPVDIGSLKSDSFVTGSLEMRLSCSIPSSNLEVLSLNDYLKIDTKPVSARAKEWRQKLFEE